MTGGEGKRGVWLAAARSRSRNAGLDRHGGALPLVIGLERREA
jgi:hypothetical protein